MKQTYLKFLIAELFVIATAIASFRFISERILAGAIAGTFFSALGFWIVFTGLRNNSVRRSATFWCGCVHLFGVALPMMITRLLNHRLEFRDVAIWGLPGPAFHQLSTAIYFLLLLTTAIDLVRTSRLAGKTSPEA